MKAHKHLQMEEHRTYNFGMCNAAVYRMKKTCYVYMLLSFLFKDNTTLGKAEETSENQSPFHTRSMWTLVFESSCRSS